MYYANVLSSKLKEIMVQGTNPSSTICQSWETHPDTGSHSPRVENTNPEQPSVSYRLPVKRPMTGTQIMSTSE
jgi:hypothetical protein